ncbi:MAG TPA: alpha/beta hydrolase [Candidatus Blautia faecipullorum]|nr:alpha/beta hydrolase [Candidatus Blautia faecipullorum]
MRLAVIFPGVGYHTDKPLLYYGKKTAMELGYEIAEAPYGNFAKHIKGSEQKMKETFVSAREQAEELLKNIKFGQYERIVFISKSLGTAVAASYASDHQIRAEHIYYTPVKASFSFMRPYKEQRGIVFHGTADPWVETLEVETGCREKELPLYITEKGNHSLETGDVLADLEHLRRIMEQTRDFLK